MLNFISTPIGNLNDISQRAINAIRTCDYLYAEDTRITQKLLKFIELKKECNSFHEHNEKKVTNTIIKQLLNDMSVSIVCDAGTPAISDPGYKLIQKCIENNIKYTLLPGPSSVINALIMSGLPTDKFSFYGFFPRKVSLQILFLEDLKNEKKTSIFFESSKRIIKTIQIASKYLHPERSISVCMEMTKIHERVIRGNLANILSIFDKEKISMKGESVIVIGRENNIKSNMKLTKKIKKEFLKQLSAADAAKLISLITEENKRDIYRSLIEK
tara:strand:- start:119 stop:934 length:816 start_codon:yes stop_codon:yes gene_type:complete